MHDIWRRIPLWKMSGRTVYEIHHIRRKQFALRSTLNFSNSYNFNITINIKANYLWNKSTLTFRCVWHFFERLKHFWMHDTGWKIIKATFHASFETQMYAEMENNWLTLFHTSIRLFIIHFVHVRCSHHDAQSFRLTLLSYRFLGHFLLYSSFEYHCVAIFSSFFLLLFVAYWHKLPQAMGNMHWRRSVRVTAAK